MARFPREGTHAGGQGRLYACVYAFNRVFLGGPGKKDLAVFYVEKSGLEFFGPYTGEQLIAMFHKGEISIFSLVRSSEVRPLEPYRFFGEILLEISPNEVKKEETEPPKTLEVYRPLHAELQYGRRPEFLASAEQRREDIQRFLQRKAAGL